jgi:chaperone BCS1
VLLPAGTVETVLSAVMEFRERAEWYASIGIPHRIGFLFEGIPGSGKTSLIAALAGHLNVSLYALNLSSAWLDDDNLTRLLNCVPNGSFILLEDIDAAFHGRKKEEGAKELTFSGLLNALDGVASKDGNMVFMTTNHVELLDPALIRPGRVDVKVHFDYARPAEVTRLFERFYPRAEGWMAAEFTRRYAGEKVSMADVQRHLLEHKDSPEKAIGLSAEVV